MNSALIMWLSKRHATCETSVFGAEFIAIKQGIEALRGLHYKRPLVEWLVCKPSTMAGAGYGLFADTDFKKGSVIGIYVGGKDCLPNYTMKTGWGGKKICYPFTHTSGLKGYAAATMGMQMMNDPTLYLEEGQELLYEINTKVKSDLFVLATCGIKKRDELFVCYNWTDKEKAQAEKANKEQEALTPK